jgi:hypothetical protein
MQILNTDVSKRRFSLFVALFGLLALCVMVAIIMQPYIAHRLASKIYANYEVYRLKYPNSYFVESKINATSKVTMATDYFYYTSDDTDTVREYMEQQMPGFVHLQGSRVIKEPTYSNSTCADETMFRYFFQVLDRSGPCVEIKIYPSDTGATSITITERWSSLGFPSWLRGL